MLKEAEIDRCEVVIERAGFNSVNVGVHMDTEWKGKPWCLMD